MASDVRRKSAPWVSYWHLATAPSRHPHPVQQAQSGHKGNATYLRYHSIINDIISS
jgi:hypothetical protein